MRSQLRVVVIISSVLVAATSAEGRERPTTNLHRAPRAEMVEGRTSASAPVEVVIGLGWRNRVALERLIRDQADPQSPHYQRFLSPREFTRRFAPRYRQLGAVARYLRAAGLRVTRVSRSRLLLSAVGPATRVEHALKTRLIDVQDGGRRRTVTASRPALPADLSAHVVAVGVGLSLRAPEAGVRARAALPLTPADVARLYGFDALYADGITGAGGRETTIAIATAFGFDRNDLETFWREHGISRSAGSVELIPIAGSGAEDDGSHVETTLDVQWATAMAPAARVLVYAGSDTMASTFVKVFDRIVNDNRAAVMTTSWGRCESDYPSGLLAEFDAIFTRAAAQGITLIAAAGDHGAFECAEDEAPSVSFPAAHPYLLAVGGTSLRVTGDGVDEVVWSGSGGGVSRHFPAPPWQMSGHAGRALSDVALNADPKTGYRVHYRGQWAMFGGTSVGAPIWAAAVALANQARATAGRPPLGVAAPHLCEAALAAGPDAPEPFLDVTDGTNGAFAAGPGFDLPTGWGVPQVAPLARALSDWTPPADARGGTTEILRLERTAAAADGAARMRFERRCLSTAVHLQARQLPAGTHTLELDGVPAATLSPDARGVAMLSLPGIDVRGHVVSLRGPTGAVLFTSDPSAAPVGPPGPMALTATLINTGMIPAASGSVAYRVTGSRHELVVRADQLADARYDVRFGAESIGSLEVRDGSGVARFDSAGMSGQPLGAPPACQPVIVARGASAYLRSASDALSPGGCR